MRELEKYRAYLQLLSDQNVDPKIKKSILCSCSDGLLCCITSIFMNVLNGAVPLSNEQYRQLKTHRKLIHNIANHRVPASRKRKQLVAGGSKISKGLFPLVIGLVLKAFDKDQIGFES